MLCCKFCSGLLVGGLVIALGSFVVAHQSKEMKGQPEMKLPPGWTQADMQACVEAGTPGKMHEWLGKATGTWQGKNTMWMAPDTQPMKSDSTATATAIMDGRFVKLDTRGEMPGMGPFAGMGLYGFDNVTQKFQSTWIDNMGTTMLMGTGELSNDGNTMTWTYHYTCPITKKPVEMREVETITGPNSRTLEMYGIDPKSGKEFKCVAIEMTRSDSGRTADLPTGR